MGLCICALKFLTTFPWNGVLEMGLLVKGQMHTVFFVSIESFLSSTVVPFCIPTRIDGRVCFSTNSPTE